MPPRSTSPDRPARAARGPRVGLAEHRRGAGRPHEDRKRPVPSPARDPAVDAPTLEQLRRRGAGEGARREGLGPAGDDREGRRGDRAMGGRSGRELVPLLRQLGAVLSGSGHDGRHRPSPRGRRGRALGFRAPLVPADRRAGHPRAPPPGGPGAGQDRHARPHLGAVRLGPGTPSLGVDRVLDRFGAPVEEHGVVDRGPHRSDPAPFRALTTFGPAAEVKDLPRTTESPPMDAKLSASRREDLLERVFDATSIGMAISRLSDGLIVEGNDAFRYLFGRDDVVGMTTFELGTWRELGDQRAMELLSGRGAIDGFDATVSGASGERRVLRLWAEVIDGEDGPLAIVRASDVDGRTTAGSRYAEMREAEVRYRTLVEQISAITYTQVEDTASPTGFRDVY